MTSSAIHTPTANPAIPNWARFIAPLIALLSRNGNLVKRPFLLTEAGGAVGFRQEEWERLLERKT